MTIKRHTSAPPYCLYINMGDDSQPYFQWIMPDRSRVPAATPPWPLPAGVPVLPPLRVGAPEFLAQPVDSLD